MRQWLDVCVTEGGLLVAQQRLHKRPLLVAQMLEEWLNHYRRIAYVEGIGNDSVCAHQCLILNVPFVFVQSSDFRSVHSTPTAYGLLERWRHR